MMGRWLLLAWGFGGVVALQAPPRRSYTPPLRAAPKGFEAAASRRSLVEGAVLAAGVALAPSVVTAAESEVPSPLRQRFFAKYDDRLKSENMEAVYGTFTPAFVAYLSRLLLTYDVASKSWWQYIQGNLPKRYDADIEQGPAMVAFSDYVTSVQIGLETFEGEKGLRRLLKLLVQRYGQNQDAKWQIAVLFSLLQPSLQPVDEIAELLEATPPVPLSGILRANQSGKRPTVAAAAAAAAEANSGVTFTSALKRVFGGSSSNLVRLLSPADVALELAYVARDGSVKPVPIPEPEVEEPLPAQSANSTAAAGSATRTAALASTGRGATGDQRAQGADGTAGAAVNASAPLTPTALAAAALKQDMPSRDSTFYRLELRTQGVATKAYVPPPVAFSLELERSLESVLTVDSFGGDLKRLRRDVSLSPPQIARFFAAGALCSSLARLILTPIDVVKTKVQADSTPGVSFGSTVKKVWDTSGAKGFFAGVDTTVAGYFVGGAAAFGCTELLKRRISSFVATTSLLGNGAGLGPDWAANHPVPITISAAATSMAIAVVLVMPFEAIRIRMVSSPKYANRNLMDVASSIYREEGIGAFYAALPFFLLKDVPFFVVKFVVFDTVAGALTTMFPAAREVASISLAISLTAGLVAGGTAAIATHPFDSLMTLVNVKGSEAGPRPPGGAAAPSPVDLIVADFKAAGVDGTVKILTRGVGSRFFFAALAVSIQFFLYDFFKIAFQISAADLSLFWDVLGGVQQTQSF